MHLNDVVQFTEDHKWCGSFGIINEIKLFSNGDVRYLVGVPIPMQGTAYIFVMSTEKCMVRIGKAVMIPDNKEE